MIVVCSPVVAAMAFRVFHLLKKSLALTDLHVSKELLREIVSIEMNEEESNTSEAIQTKLNDVGSSISNNSGPYDDDSCTKSAAK